ncbi:MAG: SRPBCC family protein [Deltaproteobacteria bacterium]|nr:SRPBCC family protein [Deltaproteobacteria bacterium]MBW2445992.1 SRPBCC family protein [Deltaproteobacteria bacterium]
MGPVDFVHEIEISVPAARVHAFLCDLDHYAPLHPLIESIEEVPASDPAPGARHYRVVDRVPLGPFKIRAEYRAALGPVSDHEIHGHARQWPGIHVHTVYHLEDIASGVRLVERVSVEAPRVLRRFVISRARSSHKATLAGIKRLLESSQE